MRLAAKLLIPVVRAAYNSIAGLIPETNTMNIIKIIHKLVKAFRGGASRRDLFLAVIVGLGLGIIPGMNLTKGILFVMLLFLNINGGVAAVTYLLTRLLRYLLAPTLYQIGYFLIHRWGFDEVVRFTLDTPVLAYLNWDVYAVLGGLVMTLLAGPILATILTLVISGTHRGLGATNLGNIRFFQVLVRVVVGKATVKKERLVKRGRCIVAVVIFGAAVWATHTYLAMGVERGLILGLEQLNGAEVNITRVEVSLSGGLLSIEGLQVTDPADPETNLVASDRLEMKISTLALLRRQLVIDQVLSEAMTLGSPRTKPGEVYRQPDTENGLLDSLLEKLGPFAKDPIRYYEQIKALNEKLEKLKEVLAKVPFTPKEKTEWELARQGYLRASARPLLQDHPAWVITSAKATHVILVPDLPDFTIEARNFSSDPSKLEDKPTLRATPNRESLDAMTGGLGDIWPWSGGDDDETDDETEGTDDEPSLLDRLGGLFSG
jgi:uncharacterized protein (TIGR03546 family)